jgi:hypothetical protein
VAGACLCTAVGAWVRHDGESNKGVGTHLAVRRFLGSICSPGFFSLRPDLDSLAERSGLATKLKRSAHDMKLFRIGLGRMEFSAIMTPRRFLVSKT